MCLCINVSFNLVTNLISRLTDDIMDVFYCKCHQKPTVPKQAQYDRDECTLDSDSEFFDEKTENHTNSHAINHHNHQQYRGDNNNQLHRSNTNSRNSTATTTKLSERENWFSDYIELEKFYKKVDRNTCEELLRNRIDGSCLVRPYKEKDINVKYVLSVYASHQFFHLFVRKSPDDDKYSLGLSKANEKRFKAPLDIVNYYSINKLRCTNKFITVYIVLIPLW